MTAAEKLLAKVPFTLTQSEWDRIPSRMKGMIKGDYNPGHMPGQMLGSKTLRVANRVLIEGMDFEIEYSLI